VILVERFVLRELAILVVRLLKCLCNVVRQRRTYARQPQRIRPENRILTVPIDINAPAQANRVR
jgi:hypothetical protein